MELFGVLLIVVFMVACFVVYSLVADATAHVKHPELTDFERQILFSEHPCIVYKYDDIKDGIQVAQKKKRAPVVKLKADTKEKALKRRLKKSPRKKTDKKKPK